MEKNYDEFDYLEIEVKKENYQKVAKCYASFGWKKNDESEHEVYGDTLQVEFERVHKQKNKDKLQLAQVRLENKFSELGKCERNHYSKTIAFALTSFLLLGALIGIGVYLIVQNLSIFANFGGIIICVISGILIIFTIVKTILTKREDDNRYKKNLKKINDEISALCDQAKKLVGEKTNV